MVRRRTLVLLILASAPLSACGAGSVSPPAPTGTAGGSSATSMQHAVPTYTFVDLGAGPNGKSALAAGADKANQGGNYIYGSGSCGKDCSFNIYHAVVWSGQGSTPVDITPPINYFPEAWVYGGTGSLLVGKGITNQGGYYGSPHALIWRGASFTWTDINPTGDSQSYAYAASGSAIAGSGGASALHAMLWTLGNLKNPTDLHPGSAYSLSEALSVSGTMQAGYALTASSPAEPHAILWKGTASSAVDLTPATATSAYAYAVNGSLQAGCGVVAPATLQHALLWKGTPASMKDLNPAGFNDSCAVGVHNGVEIGYGHTTANELHAVVWAGSAKSAVDLQLGLPSSYTQSQALNFDALGDIVGAVYSTTGGWHGALWIKQ